MARKEKIEEVIGQVGSTLNEGEFESVDLTENTESRRYCDACEVEVHNNHNWLLHIAGTPNI